VNGMLPDGIFLGVILTVDCSVCHSEQLTQKA
jgi:hypothetical protein